MARALKVERFGEKVVGVNITGNPKNAEPESFRICFPWGNVEVTRAQDGKPRDDTDYWVHVYVNNPGSVNYCPDEDSGEYAGPGAIFDARLDQTDKHASESNLGDFGRAELYHLAVKVGPLGRSR